MRIRFINMSEFGSFLYQPDCQLGLEGGWRFLGSYCKFDTQRVIVRYRSVVPDNAEYQTIRERFVADRYRRVDRQGMIDADPDAVQRNVFDVPELLVLSTAPIPTEHDEVAIQQALMRALLRHLFSSSRNVPLSSHRLSSDNSR